MQTNEELQKNVQDAIKWQPQLNAAEIGVIVCDGVVTLTGTVDSYLKKIEAENATKNVAGVRAIVEKIEVIYRKMLNKKSDSDIAYDILNIYQLNSQIPENTIKIKVEKGWVNLGGELNWSYQKEEAKNAIKNLDGIIGVTNNILIKPKALNLLEKEVIENLLKLSWTLNAEDINVSVDGTSVTLDGKVAALYQKEEAERIALGTPGIWSVQNNLHIDQVVAE
ncbi:MAG: BON domain-containing protein [Chitinophagaceae bacterium]